MDATAPTRLHQGPVLEAQISAGPAAPSGDGDSGLAGALHSDDTPPVLTEVRLQNLHRYGPRLREIFVGREAELAELVEALDLSCAGEGVFAAIVGEPGIGKTTLGERLAIQAAARGCRVVRGCCHEESRALPYLPFIEAIQGYAEQAEPGALLAELGPGGRELTRIVPGLRDRLHLEPPPPGDPDEDRWRLLEAVAGFLVNASRAQPLMLFLEDLHWADSGSLDILRHLVRPLRDSGLLVLITYRDTEVHRTHLLSATLADLRRAGAFARIHLRGLTAEDIERLCQHIAGGQVPGTMARDIYRRTEGNPLFVQEVVRHLIELGYLRTNSSTAPAPALPPSAAIPEGLLDVIDSSLIRLSPRCRQVLAVAAVIGRDFQLDVLNDVVNLAEEELFASMEEAVASGILEETQTGANLAFRFSHTLVREALYEDVFAPRRLRLHQQVALAIEARFSGRLERYAAELAGHFSHSTDPVHLARAVEYGKMAASQAAAVYAWADATRHLQRSLEILEPANVPERLLLLLDLGTALTRIRDYEAVHAVVAPEAFALASAAGDREACLTACWLAIGAFAAQLGGSAAERPTFREWVRRLDALASDGTIDRVRADFALALIAAAGGSATAADALCARALELANSIGVEPTIVASIIAIHLTGCTSPRFDARRREMLREAQALVDRVEREHHDSGRLRPPLYGGLPLFQACSEALTWGDRTAAALFARAELELATGAHSGIEDRKLPHRLLDAVLAGDLESARLVASPVLFAGAASSPAVAATCFNISFRAFQQLGKTEELLNGYRLENHSRPARPLYRVLLLASAGHIDEARRSITLPGGPPPFDPSDERWGTSFLVHYLEAAVLVGDMGLAQRIIEPLLKTDAVTTGQFFPTVIARHLADAAELLGEPLRARQYSERALAQSSEMRFRPEAALARLQLARVLLNHFPGERPAALEHLRIAADECRAMHMGPALAVARLLAQRHGQSRDSQGCSAPDRLSDREAEVLRLVAHGRTNVEIAGELVISLSTVARHLSHIFQKTSTANRAGAAAYAMRHGLVD